MKLEFLKISTNHILYTLVQILASRRKTTRLIRFYICIRIWVDHFDFKISKIFAHCNLNSLKFITNYYINHLCCCCRLLSSPRGEITLNYIYKSRPNSCRSTSLNCNLILIPPREGGRILRLGGPKIFFPGRGFFPLGILEFFF